MMWPVFITVSLFKLLFMPLYRSTDFEVHRNWLAITYSLPLEKWYLEDHSEWTLDYPPMFAWFEFLLSHIAQVFDKRMLNVENLNFVSEGTVVFQRLSVIVTDLVFMYAVKEYCDYLFKEERNIRDLNSPKYKLFILLVCNFGLVLVDHIHFQYNGFLFGVLLLSIVRICQGRCLEGSLWFATLLNLKHIYLYVAPAYFVFLLRNYCFRSHRDGGINWWSFSPIRLLGLAFVVISVFVLSFGPFVQKNQLSQVLLRLFPFKRGLCHAYWAPNFWALYNVADKASTVIGSHYGHIQNISDLQPSSMTGGLVQEFHHVVLPSVSPLVTLICTIMSILPCMAHLWTHGSRPSDFIRGITLCGFGSYMFGWHVHEKAILIVIIPLLLLCAEDRSAARVFVILSTVGHYSLFPLIFTQFETAVKYSMMCIYTCLVFAFIKSFFRVQKPGRNKGLLSSLPCLPLINIFESVYLLGLVPLEIYNSFIHSYIGLATRLPFLPLLLTSSYCAVGVSYCWLVLYWNTLSSAKKLKAA